MISIVLFGAPGTGKTTLGRLVAEQLGLSFIGSGDVARELAQRDRNIAGELERGEWASELAMRTEILARMEAAQMKSGDFVIEGFPRKLEQLFILEQIPGICPLYFSIEVDSLTCLRRLVIRGRKSDHPDAVATRIRAYEEWTLPVICTVSEQCCFLDGRETPEVLAQQVVDEYNREKLRVA